MSEGFLRIGGGESACSLCVSLRASGATAFTLRDLHLGVTHYERVIVTKQFGGQQFIHSCAHPFLLTRASGCRTTLGGKPGTNMTRSQRGFGNPPRSSCGCSF